MLRVYPIFEWYEDAMVFYEFIFIFLFRTNGKKGQMDQNDFRHFFGDIFERTILEVT